MKTLLRIAVVVAATCAFVTSASANIAYQVPTGSWGNQANGPYALGLQFQVGAIDLTVTALGAFDNNQDGWTAPISVAIYDSGGAMLGTSVQFSGTSGANLGTLVAGSRFLDVTPFTLTAGQTYMVVAAGYGGGSLEQNWNGNHAGPSPTLSQDSAITHKLSFYSTTTGSTLVFPTTSDNVYFPQYAAGTFDFTPVPEASQYAIAGVGLLGLVYVGRCAFQRRTAKA